MSHKYKRETRSKWRDRETEVQQIRGHLNEIAAVVREIAEAAPRVDLYEDESVRNVAELAQRLSVLANTLARAADDTAKRDARGM